MILAVNIKKVNVNLMYHRRETVMSEVEEAVKIAVNAAEKIFEIYSIKVEEVNYDETETTWLVTLSWNDTEKDGDGPSLKGDGGRVYKVFHIDVNEGQGDLKDVT